MDAVSYILSRKYTEDTAIGLGAVRGKPCNIQSITPTDDGNRVTFRWTGDDGTVQTSAMLVKNGIDGESIVSIEIDANNRLKCTLTDGAVIVTNPLDLSAEKIDYTNAEVSGVSNVQQALDKLFEGDASSEEQIKDWVSGETYEIGDYVYYDGKLYRCTTENSDVDFSGINWKNLSGSEGGTGEGLTTEQAQQLTTAYEHSQTPHVSADDIPTKTSDLTNDSGFITSIPEEYITETELEAKGYLTSHQDISGLQTKTDNNLTTTSKEVVGAINEVKDMADLILDTEVRLDKTYSSSKIYQDIQQCLNDSKTFTLLELGKFSGVSYKIVASTSEMTSESIIYLLANGNTYDMYIVEENGATTKIGDTNVNLSDYYTKTEIDNDFLKKVDADGEYATITTVNGKVDKDKIVTVLDDTVTDEQVPSARIVVDELGLKANDSEVVKKTDITTTIDSSSTDEQVPSAKVSYDRIKGLEDKVKDGKFYINYTNFDKLLNYYGLTKKNYTIEELFLALPDGIRFGVAYNNDTVTNKITDLPNGSYFFITIEKALTNYNIVHAYNINNGNYYMWRYHSNSTLARKWEIMSKISIADADVDITDIPLPSNLVYDNYTRICYQIMNGVCYVDIYLRMVQSVSSSTVEISGLPIPKTQINFSGNGEKAGKALIGSIKTDGLMRMHNIPTDKTGDNYSISFSYPVAQ